MVPVTITLKDGATRWCVCQATLRRKIRLGEIEAVRPGKVTLVLVASGDAWFMGTSAKLIKGGRRRRRIQ